MAVLRSTAAATLILILGACTVPAHEEDEATTSADLLTTDASFAEDVTVADDHLSLPLTGHEAVLDYPAGKLLVGGPSKANDGAKNPHGFLRRLTRVRRAGDTIILETAPATLTELFPGDVEIGGSAIVEAPPPSAGALRDKTLELTKRIELPETKLFERQLKSGPVTWDVDMGVDGGYIDFAPSVTTDIKLKGASLQSVKIVAAGKLDADLSMSIRVVAKNPTSAESDLQTFEKVLYKAPRVRWAQMVGVVPVWESLEFSVVARCGLRVRATVDAGVGFHASATIEAGGEYRKAGGIKGILEGPTLDFTPRWHADVSGNVYAKCALLPQVTLFVYDAAGPTLTAGPYVEGALTRTTSGPTRWSADAGFSVDVGGKVSIFGHDVVDEHVTVFDEKLASYDGSLPL